MIEEILAKILMDGATYEVHAYKGIGHLPKGLNSSSDPSKRVLLDRLPKILSGYGRAFSKDAANYKRSVFVVCDLDNRDASEFEAEILEVLQKCHPAPVTAICFCVEEGEAWLLGDVDAVLAAYPRVNKANLLRYLPDAICGTWEVLADLVEKGGAKELKKLGYREVGNVKHRWARAIAPHIEFNRNRSPSLQSFVAKLSISKTEADFGRQQTTAAN